MFEIDVSSVSYYTCLLNLIKVQIREARALSLSERIDSNIKAE